jgi:hypothetical protein
VVEPGKLFFLGCSTVASATFSKAGKNLWRRKRRK